MNDESTYKKLFTVTKNETGKFVHPFEATLGPRPYSVDDIYECRPGEANLICDHCGENTLRTKFFIMADNGARFGVGSRCVELLDLDPEEYAKFQQLKREKARRDRRARLLKKTIEMLDVCLNKVQGDGRTFIISLHEQFQTKGKLSAKQKSALNKFYVRCK